MPRFDQRLPDLLWREQEPIPSRLIRVVIKQCGASRPQSTVSKQFDRLQGEATILCAVDLRDGIPAVFFTVATFELAQMSARSTLGIVSPWSRIASADGLRWPICLVSFWINGVGVLLIVRDVILEQQCIMYTRHALRQRIVHHPFQSQNELLF